MSVELEEPGRQPLRAGRSARDIAAEFQLDARIPGAVPGFDAPFFQAGLAGYSDSAMRLIARQLGAPFCVTESLLDRLLLSGGNKRVEHPDTLADEFGFGDAEHDRAAGLRDHPIAGQLMASDPDSAARGAERLIALGYDVVDVNLACPVKKVDKACRGGRLLAEPERAIALLEAVRTSVPAHTPTTVKMRRGYDLSTEGANDFHRIFDAAYELGYSWVTVHARTVVQLYRGASDWSFLRDLVARYPDRLIFGSGDVWSAESIFEMLDVTGVQAVSVARGCIGDPWLFRRARQLLTGETPTEPTLADRRRVLLDHLRFAVQLYGEGIAVRHLRKFAMRFVDRHADRDAAKRAFQKCDSQLRWQREIQRFYGDG